MFDKIKRFFMLGLYAPAHVAHFVEKGKITQQEYQQIVGEAYESDAPAILSDDNT